MMFKRFDAKFNYAQTFFLYRHFFVTKNGLKSMPKKNLDFERASQQVTFNQ
jgi:hypothetical protein